MDLTRTKELATTIRVLSAEAVQAANSGHPGMPMGAADYASVLWQNFLKFNPENPQWIGRDRFVLSAGHGSMLLYSLLHLFGYNLPISELKNFRQWDSKTPGHPEFGWTEGVETTTGPLGQGFANGVGMAISSKMLEARYGNLFGYRVFGIVSDGDLMEGVSYESASLAGHLKLNNLVYLYDDNHISIGGDTDVCFTEDVGKRFEAQGWFVQKVDGHDLVQITEAIEFAINEQDRPSIICCRTYIGKGAATQEGNHEIHGSPLGDVELAATKKGLGIPEGTPAFSVPESVKAYCDASVEVKKQEYKEWNNQFEAWKKSNYELATEFAKQESRDVPPELKKELIEVFSKSGKSATRALSGNVIQVLAKYLPSFIGGSADLEPSTKTLIKGSSDIQPNAFEGKNLRFGVREHAMGSIVNGLAYSQYWIPYSATFLVFADYMRPTIRLAALSHLQSLFIFTHDSFHVGEDGPTHQPVEHIASLRAIPNLMVFRPADGLETAMSYYASVTNKKRPSTLLFTRQDLEPVVRDDSFNADDILKGAYVAYGQATSDLVIVATGSEVSLAIDTAKALEIDGIKLRVVSMPCMELFLEQSDEYKNSVIPTAAKKIALEAGLMFGWDRIVGDGLKIGKSDYGASAPAKVLCEKFGFTVKGVSEKIKSWI